MRQDLKYDNYVMPSYSRSAAGVSRRDRNIPPEAVVDRFGAVLAEKIPRPSTESSVILFAYQSAGRKMTVNFCVHGLNSPDSPGQF